MADARGADRPFRWLVATVVVGLALFGLLDVRRRARVDPEQPSAHKTDLTIFTGAGQAFLADAEPYAYANPRGWKYCYLPLLALTLAPLAGFHPQVQAIVWYAVSCLCGWLAWREAVRISRGCGLDVRLAPGNASDGRWVGWLAVAACTLPALNTLQRGQVGLLYLWLLLWGYRLLVEAVTWRGALAAGLVLALPGVIKLTPALPAVAVLGAWGLMRWRERQFSAALAGPAGLAGGVVLSVLLIPAALLGWETNLRHLRTWSATIVTMAVDVDPDSAVETPYTPRNQSLSNAVYRCGNWLHFAVAGGPDDRLIDAVPIPVDHQLLMDAAWVSPALLALRLALVALLALAGIVVVWRRDRLGQAGLFGLACAASLIVSPLSRGHYFVLLLPAALWSTPAIRRLRTAEAVATRRLLRGGPWLMTLPVLTGLHYGLLPVAGRIGLLGLGLAVWYVAATLALIHTAVRAGAEAPQTEPHQGAGRQESSSEVAMPPQPTSRAA